MRKLCSVSYVGEDLMIYIPEGQRLIDIKPWDIVDCDGRTEIFRPAMIGMDYRLVSVVVSPEHRELDQGALIELYGKTRGFVQHPGWGRWAEDPQSARTGFLHVGKPKVKNMLDVVLAVQGWQRGWIRDVPFINTAVSAHCVIYGDGPPDRIFRDAEKGTARVTGGTWVALIDPGNDHPVYLARTRECSDDQLCAELIQRFEVDRRVDLHLLADQLLRGSHKSRARRRRRDRTGEAPPTR